MSDKGKFVWMPHAGHFICGSRCQFKLNTYVGGYIVSTVGELPDTFKEESGKFTTIGLDRLYETMVFKARKSNNKCCPYEQTSGSEIDFAGYNKPEDAMVGHMKLCMKWAKKVRP